MTDPMILYAGMFCVAMTILGLVITANEFRKM